MKSVRLFPRCESKGSSFAKLLQRSENIIILPTSKIRLCYTPYFEEKPRKTYGYITFRCRIFHKYFLTLMFVLSFIGSKRYFIFDIFFFIYLFHILHLLFTVSAQIDYDNPNSVNMHLAASNNVVLAFSYSRHDDQSTVWINLTIKVSPATKVSII